MLIPKAPTEQDAPGVQAVDELGRPTEQQLRSPRTETEDRAYYTRLLALALREQVKQKYPEKSDEDAREWLLHRVSLVGDGKGEKWREMENGGRNLTWLGIDDAMFLRDALNGIPEAVTRDHNRIKKALATLRELGLRTAVLEYGGWKFPVTEPSFGEILDKVFDV